VDEKTQNLVGFERAMGAAQHVSLDPVFLRPSASALPAPRQPSSQRASSGSCRFLCNADKGHTWPFDVPKTRLAQDATFDFPYIPSQSRNLQSTSTSEEMKSNLNKTAQSEAGPDSNHSVVDWREYPRGGKDSNLCTLRISPSDATGWFVAACSPAPTPADTASLTPSPSPPSSPLCLCYCWERKRFPWLMTWEENGSRTHPPWNGNTLVRGLEFSSYAFATSRRDNVARGRLFDTPTFEWLDAFETKSTTFYVTLCSGDRLAPAIGELNLPGDPQITIPRSP